MKGIVFDLGGTLMEYENMALSWEGYYYDAFLSVRESLALDISDEDIEKSVAVLRNYNPRIQYREIEYSPEQIFFDVTAFWRVETDVRKVITEFFKGLKLRPIIFEDAVQTLGELKNRQYKLAALTDLPTAMPDEILIEGIGPIIKELDFYVSSLTCGFRKPNPYGLRSIAEHFCVTTGDLLFIGDEEKDIKTAFNAGCKSVLIRRDGNTGCEFGQDFTITRLSELDNVLRSP